jgi:hypothetical protein
VAVDVVVGGRGVNVTVFVGFAVGGSDVNVTLIVGVAVEVRFSVTGVVVGAFMVILAITVCAAWVLIRFWSMVGAVVLVGSATVGALVRVAVGADRAYFKLQLLRIVTTRKAARILYSIGFKLMSNLHIDNF